MYAVEEEIQVKEVEQSALRRLVSKVAGYSSDSLGDACGGGCGRGANCSTRSAEMEALLCGAD